MSEPLGTHVLIDLYACYEGTLNDPVIVQNCLHQSLAAMEVAAYETYCQVGEGEFTLVSLAPQCHITVHAYPELGYVAVDVYSFSINVSSPKLMRIFRNELGAEKVKATSIQRADFGSQRDMKPRKRTKVSTLARMSRTYTQLKKPGNKLKTTGAKLIKGMVKKKEQ